MLCIVAVETFGRFPAGKTHLGLYLYSMVGLGLYCTVGTLWDPTLTRSNMGIAMRALVAVWPALALSFGRVVIPIHGMDDPRYGFFSKGTYSPGLSLVPGFCADYSATQFEDGLLPFNSSARYGHFTSDFGPPSPPIRRDDCRLPDKLG